MLEPRTRDKPRPVKLFCGLIARPEALDRARPLLIESFGEIDCESPVLRFDFTSYYADEMGDDLVRKWVAFETLRERAYLARAKHIAVWLEHRLASGARRAVNIDPGYVDAAQVVLATAKNYSHRIYIGLGYYAEVTLTYEHGAFKFLEWTYPDYRTHEGLSFLGAARSAYVIQARDRASL